MRRDSGSISRSIGLFGWSFPSILVFAFTAASHAQKLEDPHIQRDTQLFRAAAGGSPGMEVVSARGLDIERDHFDAFGGSPAALVSGDLGYQSGIGPASISATLSGVDSTTITLEKRGFTPKDSRHHLDI